MADLMATAHTWLAGKRRDYRTQTATYSRGATSLSVAATILGHMGYASGAEPVRALVMELDFVVAASEIESLGEPQRGDTIDVNRDGTTHRYEVQADGSGRWWAWSNPTVHTEYRIHTKYAGTV